MFQSLKSRLTINLAFFLLLAVLLTDFVVVRIVEKNLIQNRIEQGRRFIAEAPDIFRGDSLNKAAPAWIVHGVFFQGRGRYTGFGEKPKDLSFDPRQASREAIDTEKNTVSFVGTAWGVFWRQSKYMAVSGPVSGRFGSGGASVVIKLDDIYLTLRKSQKIIFFYSLANLFILIFFSGLGMTRIVVRPIHRFIRLAEDLRSTEQFPAYPAKRGYELSRLSNAIQQMARRIEADKEKIESSLHSLEKTHDELKKAQNEMLRAEKLASIGRLSAGIAHEIGNPIGIVLGYLGLLKRQPGTESDPKSIDYIERAESEINRINYIIRQLLDFSRASPGEKKMISVHELARDVGGMLSEQPLMRNIELSYDLKASSDKVYADYQQLRQVLINLMINAADSIRLSDHPEEGRIRLETREIPPGSDSAVEGSASIELTVADNGTGIPGEEIENIFDPFYTTKDPGKGTGLGLSVSYMIIEQFGGCIKARSEVNKGTAMSVYLMLETGTGGNQVQEFFDRG